MSLDTPTYDVIVIGAGAAGCSAAIYATRYAMKTLLIGGPMPGGLISEAVDVENYPGYLSISGMELAQKFVEQAKALGAEYSIESVSKISPQEGGFLVSTDSQVYTAKSVILATGTHHRHLGAPGEKEFAGRGVSYCATCDAAFFKGKTVAVIGGGNSAVEGAQSVSDHAKQVYLIYRSTLSATPLYIEELRGRKNVMEIPKTTVTEIKGDQKVTGVVLDVPFDGKSELAVDGVFIEIGYVPQNGLAKSLGVRLTTHGYVAVDAGMGSSLPGVFCAGDLNNASNQMHQQVTSSADGAIAAQSAYRYIHGLDHVIREE